MFSMASLCITERAFPSGPLRRCTANPRYFCDGSGRPTILTGAHTWNNLQDAAPSNPPVPFDYADYLEFLQNYNHNFFRLWVWEQSKWAADLIGDIWFEPAIYRRTGPGVALDGEPRFDVTKFNEEFFLRLRERVVQAREKGIYVSVMLFNGWSVDGKTMNGGNPWRGHPFNGKNNINGIDGDGRGNGFGLETHTLGNIAITRLQEAYVRKVVDTLNDLNNVLWEISNESPPGSELWQYHFVKFIKKYEARKPSQHPVGMTIPYPGGNNVALAESPADWISPNEWGKTSYKDDPPEANGKKVIIADTDHLRGIGGDFKWAWKSFLRGLNPILRDPYQAADVLDGVPAEFRSGGQKLARLRLNLGYIRAYADRIGLARMVPRTDLSSTRYCLADPGSQYLVYQPVKGSFTVQLRAGTYEAEWFDPVDGSRSMEKVTVEASASKGFSIPSHAAEGVVLLLKKVFTGVTIQHTTKACHSRGFNRESRF